MSSPIRRHLPAFAALAAVALAAGTASANNRSWINGAGGAATTTTNWSPAGIPIPSDYCFFEVPATFTTSWASPADSIGNMTVAAGNPNFTIANRLGIGGNLLITEVSSLTISSTSAVVTRNAPW